MTPVDPGVWRAYLLGRLSDEEAQRLEEQYFGDEPAFDEVVLAEDDLIDDYLDDALPADDRACFEERVSARPELAVRVDARRRLTRALRRRAAAGPEMPRLGLRQKALGLAAVAAAVFVSVRAYQEKPAPVPGQAESRRPAARAAAAPAQMSAPAPAALEPIVLLLGAASVRDRSTVPTAMVPAGAPAVRLVLPLGRAADGKVSTVVEDLDGRTVWTGPARTSGAGTDTRAEADVPAAVLRPGDYIARYRGLPDGDDEAFFRIGR